MRKNLALIDVLNLTNKYIVGVIFIFSVIILFGSGTILYQSHKNICEMFNSKMESSGAGIARELALSEKDVAMFLFNQVKSSLGSVASEVNLVLLPYPLLGKSQVCKASFFHANISQEIIFTDTPVGSIVGEIRSLKLYEYVIFISGVFVFLFLFFQLIRNKLLKNIQDGLVAPIEMLCHQEGAMGDHLPYEVQSIAKKLLDMKYSIAISEKAKLEISHAEKLSAIAHQVAHDMRSPLEVLKGLRSELESLPEVSRQRLQLSIGRIEEISNNLLVEHKKNLISVIDSSAQHLLPLIENIIMEKRLEWAGKSQVILSSTFYEKSYDLFIAMNGVDLKSIISNLVNNAIESFGEKEGRVDISLVEFNEKLMISVKDNGPGVSALIRDKMFVKGVTTKINGHGIGLYQAQKILQEIGGKIEFHSEWGEGSEFKLILPRAKAPVTFLSSLNLGEIKKIIILDDDLSFHEVWKMKLVHSNAELVHFYSAKDLINSNELINPSTLLLCDFELGDSVLDGLDVIRSLSIQANSILVTGRSEDLLVQEKSKEMGIKVLAKSAIHYLPITFEKPRFVLIDDDKLTHLNWLHFAKKNNLELRCFYSVESFLNEASHFNLSTAFYIDSKLGVDLFGEVESKKISKLGFKRLYLATAFEASDIKRPYWILKVYSKNPESMLSLSIS